ncbi:MAG: aldehyde dehydrogenase family protein [Dehalococcoidales bacterium]|jgi:acyl-CoA reductase-like NAD-dependent aldehyde dehydrogenase
MQQFKMWIGGKFVDADSGKTFTTRNPATGEEIARVPLAGKSDVDKAVAAARKAFPAWANKAQAERSDIVTRIAAAIRENADELARLEVMEHGSPAELAAFMLRFAAGNMEFAASIARNMMGEVLPPVYNMGEANQTEPNVVSYLKREPIGVCALITPWNVPSLMIASKIGPCLAAGNTCVVKPPSINSMIGLKWAEILAELDLPPGIVNIITGPGGSVGNALSCHPGVDMISFTGSCETGKDILAAASQTVKRTCMELGGKNPVIILEDADLDYTAEELVRITFQNTSQNCAAPSRLYVQEKVYDTFINKFVACVKKIKVGNGADKNTTMGPLVSEEHRAKVEGYIKSGIEEGAKLVLGGERPASPDLKNGYFLMPTVFKDVTQDMKIAREEIFGPVVGFHKFGTDAQALAWANDSAYGLCASVWTKDLSRGLKLVNKLQVGSTWINQHMNLVTEFPWGGFKESGLGKETGVLGLEGYTQYKLVCLKYT